MNDTDLDPALVKQLEAARTQAEAEYQAGLLVHIRVPANDLQQARKIHAELSPDMEFDDDLMRQAMVIQTRQLQILNQQPLPQRSRHPARAEPAQSLNYGQPKDGGGQQVTCPKCRSNQITAQRQGFGLGKAAVGGVLTGGVGLLAGFLGSRKVRVTCLSCGHSWFPGK